MNTQTILAQSLRCQAANRVLHNYITADITFHGFNAPDVLANQAGLTDQEVDRLERGLDGWDVSKLMKVAKYLRGTDTTSLILGWSLSYTEAFRD